MDSDWISAITSWEGKELLTKADPLDSIPMAKEPMILLEETSPHGNLEAVVEQDDRVAYLYVRAPGRTDLEFKSLWLRNLSAAPEKVNAAEMREGLAPMLSIENCLHPTGKEPLDGSRLRFLWFPEGDGVALLEDGQPLAVVPSWAITGEFPGYSRDAVGESFLCWGLAEATEIFDRVRAAVTYWNDWNRDPTPWQLCQNAFLAEYERALGPHSRYFAIDGKEWPYKALIRTDTTDAIYLLTLGISLRPQPQVEMYYEDASDFRRFEFAACFAPGAKEETITRMANYLSGQSTLPWENITFLGNGHTIPCDAFRDDPDLHHFTAVLLIDQPPGAPELNPPRMEGDRVMLLWAIPITERERQLVIERKSAAFVEKFPADWPLHRIAKRPPL